MPHGQRRLHFISTAKNAVVTVQENVAVTVQVAADAATAVAVSVSFAVAVSAQAWSEKALRSLKKPWE